MVDMVARKTPVEFHEVCVIECLTTEGTVTLVHGGKYGAEVRKRKFGPCIVETKQYTTTRKIKYNKG